MCCRKRENLYPEDKRISRLQSLSDETTMDNELEAREDRADGGRPPFCAVEVEAVSTVISFLHEKSLRRFAGLPGLEDQPCRRLPSSGCGQGRSSFTPSAKAMRRHARCGSDQGHRTGHRGQPVPWRGIAQGARTLGTYKGICALRARVLRLMRRTTACSPSPVEDRSCAPRSHDGTIIPVDESMRCGAPT